MQYATRSGREPREQIDMADVPTGYLSKLSEVRRLLDKIARKFPELPVVGLEIVSQTVAPCPRTLGFSALGGGKIMITDLCFEAGELTSTVLHEVCHALFSVKHVEHCILMCPTIGAPQEEGALWAVFEKYALNYINNNK